MYNFKAKKIIINGEEFLLEPKTLPTSPEEGFVCLDESDHILKYYNGTQWVVLKPIKIQKDDIDEVEDVYIINFEGNVEVVDEGNGKATISVIFGKNFQEASDLTLSQTTSESFQQKLRMTTPSLPVGKYRIGFVYTWQYGLASNDFKARIQVNDTDTIMEHQQEPKDQYANQIVYNSGFIYYNASVAGVLNIDLDYCGNSGNTASIANTRLEIWRVS